MNNNIIPLREPKEGDQTFFVCGCQPDDPQPFLPIVIMQKAPIVAAMMCPLCRSMYAVVNGIVQPHHSAPVPTSPKTRQEVIAEAERKIGDADLDDGC